MTSNPIQSVLIVGPGAVGSMLAANSCMGLSGGLYPMKIRLAGSENLSIFSRLHLEKINSVGLFLKSNIKKSSIAKPNVEFSPSSEKADLVIFAVKVFDLVEASKMFLPSISSSTIVLVVSNGLGVSEKLDENIDRNNCFRGLIETGCELVGSGEIVQHGESRLELSPNDAGQSCCIQNAFEKIEFFFQNSGFKVSTCDNSRLSEWKKFIVNSSINPLATLFECKNGDLLREPIIYILSELCSEIQQLVDSEKLSIDVRAKVLKIARNTYENQNSMLKSFLKRRKSELQEFTGEILRLAVSNELHLPLNKFLFNALRIIEDRNKM
ncbi:MAG: 2-dehydropantoate 2-reductase [Nitrospinota bacterium]|nr:2-dehydropantoate 2-reductase [Nitrospinota bacterium]